MAVLPFIGLHVELEGAEELLSVEIRLRTVDRRPREPVRVRAPVGAAVLKVSDVMLYA
jgi:hypothetical protein